MVTSKKRASKKAGQKSKPTVLVTGAAGALARQVIDSLKASHHIVAVDFRRLPKFSDDVATYVGDVNKRQFEDIFRQHDIQGVIHLGRMESDEQTPERRYNANVLGTQRLLKLCLSYGVKQVLILSTFYVYGASAYNPVLLREDAPLKAVGLTKDLVDSVELENLANIYLWKHPELNVTVLRPCHIAGPQVNNTMSRLLAKPIAPVLAGFSPMMQFIHIDDMGRAIALAYAKNIPGIYNVAPNEWLDYMSVLKQCGCKPFFIPSFPPVIPTAISRLMRWRAFPSFLIDYFKYAVIIDGQHFEKTFGFKTKISLEDVMRHYEQSKRTR